MFETVAPELIVRKGRTRSWKALPASILVHAMAFAAVPIGAAWKVEFPTNSPAQMVAYNLSDPPPPPPPPPPPAAPKPQVVQPKPEEPKRPEEIVAPTIIPEEIPVVPPPEPVHEEVPVDAGVEGGIEGGVPGGVVGGSPEGVPGGIVGGTPGGVVGGIIDDGQRIIVPRDVLLPLDVVSRPFPIYPEKARAKGWQDQVLVRYIIGKNGRVKEVTILAPASRKMFDEAAVDAIREWRFKPMIKDGEKREVVHELTVFFKLNFK